MLNIKSARFPWNTHKKDFLLLHKLLLIITFLIKKKKKNALNQKGMQNISIFHTWSQTFWTQLYTLKFFILWGANV